MITDLIENMFVLRARLCETNAMGTFGFQQHTLKTFWLPEEA